MPQIVQERLPDVGILSEQTRVRFSEQSGEAIQHGLGTRAAGSHGQREQRTRRGFGAASDPGHQPIRRQRTVAWHDRRDTAYERLRRSYGQDRGWNRRSRHGRV